MQTFSNLLNYRHSIQKNSIFGWVMAAIWCTLLSNQTTFAQLPNGFEPLEQARVVKRIAIRQVPENGIIRLSEEHCGLGMHVAGVRLVYSRNDHQSLQGQDWNASLSYTLLRPQDKNNSSNTAANIPIGTAHSLAIGEQVTAPYLQTFIAAKTHTIDYSSLNLNYEYNEAELRIRVNNLPILHQNAPQNIWLELELYETSKLPFSPDKKDYHFMARQVGTDIVAAWDYVETAYEYELEWVWIDKAETKEENPDSDFDENWITTTPEKIFKYREGVTVQTTDQHFIFPNTFLQGRIFYRVRAIGRFIPEDVPNYGEWNYGYDKVTNTKSTTFITLSEDYQTQHNWQSVTSFAENAKYKTVVSYHDGTGRNRQVVTHLSSEKRTLIAETLYDYEGNPTVNILPVSLEGTNLSYHEDLNPFENANPFSKNNYDNGATSTALSTTSGAAQYYSANNTSGGRYTERLPDAQGFAYSRTTYLRDGTGRVREQGGLGEIYQVGSEHSTKMYYGSTNDTELKRLFGSNVGKASFYRKQITQDPNGQLSVSYLDAAGQVIATALTGKSPDNVDSLDSYEARQIDVDLKDNNIADTLNRRLLSENTIFNNIPNTEYNFTYKVDAKTGNFMGTCLTCQYELSISIYDENGVGMNFIDPTTTPNVVFATGLFTKTIDPATCNLAQDYEVEFQVILPEIGTYQIRKELRVLSNEKLEAKVNSVINSIQTNIYTKYEQEALANNPCDICFTCFPADYNPLELFEGMDCESILAQIENAVAEDPVTYPTVESHPEYCHYLACQKMTPSQTYMLQLSRIFDWNEAIALGVVREPIDQYDRDNALSFAIEQNPILTIEPQGIPISDFYRIIFHYNLRNIKQHNSIDNLINPQTDEPISIWDYLDPYISPTLYPMFYNQEGVNIPYQGVDLSNATAVAERKWDLFRSNYYKAYEIVKREILENEFECPYLEDQENAIVKNPTTALADDSTIADSEFDNSVNCTLQVQLWTGVLQNLSCDDATIDWTMIQTQLENYCDDVNPRENPTYILYDDNDYIHQVVNELMTKCPTIDISSLIFPDKCIHQEFMPSAIDSPSENSVIDYRDGLVNMQLDPTMDLSQSSFTIQFYSTSYSGGGLILWDDIEIGYNSAFDGNPRVKVGNLYFPIAPINKRCVLHTLTIETQDEVRSIKMYLDDQLIGEAQTTELPEALQLGNVLTVGRHHYSSDCYIGNPNKIWDVRIWQQVRTQEQIQSDLSGVISNPTSLIAHWPLRGGDPTPDPVGTYVHGEAQGITFYPNNPRPVYWQGFCCTDTGGNNTNPFGQTEISLADEKTECIKRFKEIGRRDAQLIIDRKRNELRAELTAKYTQNCLATNETFTYSYTTAEHHYTLYYYDQAGNLVQTVSPEGVDVLTEAEVEDGDDPEHNLKTRYAYNSLNAPIDQETPDAGKSEFFYDKVARIRLSQNAQQADSSFYSYTKYDAQGRITEVGQLEKNADGTNPVLNELLEKVDLLSFPSQTDYILTQITRTFYDDEAAGTPTQITPKNLRGRIAAVKVFEDGQNQGAATFYDYDIHGNVAKLVQSLPELEPKTVEYSYDLLSGNVHRVTYQKGRPDQFMHRYTYDADNRLEAVFTSSDGYIWDEDARYLYYAH